MGDWLFFAADDGFTGYELWKTNGVTTELVRDINQGSSDSISRVICTGDFCLSGGSGPFDFEAVGGLLYFVADDGEGDELWRTDGSSAGTSKVDSSGEYIYPSNLVASDGRLFFLGTFEWGLYSLFVLDGPGSDPRVLTPSASVAGWCGLIPTPGRIWFCAEDENGMELWSSDGTTEGTGMVADLVSGSGSSYPSNLAATSTRLFFSAYTERYGNELWAKAL